MQILESGKVRNYTKIEKIQEKQRKCSQNLRISKKSCTFAAKFEKLMEITFEKEYLSELYYTGKSTDKKHRFQPNIVKRYVRTIDILEAVNSVEDLYRFHALHYEVLVGDKKGLESVRVGDQYRIEFQSKKIVGETIITICNIIELTNHYQ